MNIRGLDLVHLLVGNISKHNSDCSKVIDITPSQTVLNPHEQILISIYCICVTPLNIYCSICEFHGIQRCLRRQCLHGDLR